MPYYNTIKPKNEIDVFNSLSPAIAVMKKEFGDTHLRAFMVKILNDLIDFLSVGKSMGAVQVAQTADLIIDEFYYFKPEDFKLCFNRAKKGLYGKSYDRIDGQVIFNWLNMYNIQRASSADIESYNSQFFEESDFDFTGDAYIRTSDRERDKEHSYKLEHFKSQFSPK